MAKRLTPAQLRAIEALLTNNTVTDAAKAAGVDRRTLQRWMAEKEFCDTLRQAESELLSGMSRQVTAYAATALKVLYGVMLAKDSSAGVRVRAAEALLTRFHQVKELVEFEGRLTALENKR
jgi:hypothetical protein